jgi:quercetin dioxygenase-like cupin family protein
MTKTFNRRLAIKAAIAYSVVSGGAKAFAFNLFAQTVEEHATPSQRRTKMDELTLQYPPLPADDLKRNLTLAQIDQEKTLPHIGLVGDTYTITVTGAETAGRFCVIDMHIPPGGGPPPHRHDFEETFILLEGEMEATFRGQKSIVKAGETVNIPANAPHRFHNTSPNATRLLCICSPAGQDEFFKEVGTPVATRTTPPPKLDKDQQQQFMEKAKSLAPKYRTELLKEV